MDSPGPKNMREENPALRSLRSKLRVSTALTWTANSSSYSSRDARTGRTIWKQKSLSCHSTPGCKNRYAERLADRMHAMGQANYRNGFKVTLQPQMLELPLRWKAPKRIFVDLMPRPRGQWRPTDTGMRDGKRGAGKCRSWPSYGLPTGSCETGRGHAS